MTKNISKNCPRGNPLKEYFIPPSGTFYLTDVKNLSSFSAISGFDIIYIDPPWKNKSVKRSRKYGTTEMTILEDLNIPALRSEIGFIVIWITNNSRVEKYVTGVMEKYQLVKKSCWTWIKLAASGETVYPLDNPHKTPSERLLFFGPQSGKEIPERSGFFKSPKISIFAKIVIFDQNCDFRQNCDF